VRRAQGSSPCRVAAIVALAVVAHAGAQFSRINPGRPLPDGTGTITGTVFTDTGRPAAGATVTLRAAPFEPLDVQSSGYLARETTADSRGRFTFDRVPDEALELTASMPGMPDIAYGQVHPGVPGTPIRVSRGRQFDAALRFTPGGALSGTVFDRRGAPAPGIRVFAFRLEPLGDDEMLMGPGGDATTDEQGRYRIGALPPGRYVVLAYRDRHGEPAPLEPAGPNAWAIESAAFYRDAVLADDAERVPVGQGDERSGIDLRLAVSPVTTIGGVCDARTATSPRTRRCGCSGARIRPSPFHERPPALTACSRCRASPQASTTYEPLQRRNSRSSGACLWCRTARRRHSSP
jgi:hypothetical protein